MSDCARRPRGFTLIELLISISIFLLITGSVIMSFASGKYRDELVSAGGLVQSVVREAQSFTSAGSTAACPGVSPAAPPVGGYGVYMNQVVGQLPELIVFADCDPSSTIKTFDNSPPGDCDDGNCDDVIIRRVAMPARVNLVNVQPALPLNVVFSPLDEIVVVNNGSGFTGEASVELQHEKTNRKISLKVNTATGQVFVTPPYD